MGRDVQVAAPVSKVNVATQQPVVNVAEARSVNAQMAPSVVNAAVPAPKVVFASLPKDVNVVVAPSKVNVASGAPNVHVINEQQPSSAPIVGAVREQLSQVHGKREPLTGDIVNQRAEVYPTASEPREKIQYKQAPSLFGTSS